jgi:hypothetical protein
MSLNREVDVGMLVEELSIRLDVSLLIGRISDLSYSK